MDGETFDRLAVAVSRRGALRAVLAGALALPALAAGEAEARRRRRPRPPWWGGGGGYPGQTCGLQTCLPGYGCCRSGDGNHRCTLPGFPTCCQGSGWGGDYRCCRGGGACRVGDSCFGGGLCCGHGLSRCGGTCCPTGNGWRCRGGRCALAVGSAARAGVGPAAPFAPDPADSVALAAGEGEA
jgi:hypothetical protein